MFNKLHDAIKLAENVEFENDALDNIMLDEDFDESIEEMLKEDIVKLIMEEMDLYDNDVILIEEAENDDFDEENEIEDEEIEDEELEDLLESVLEDF